MMARVPREVQRVIVRLSPEQRSIVHERIAGALREIGTLLVAFAPLDYTMSESAGAWSLAGFLILGGCLFTLGVYSELRRKA